MHDPLIHTIALGLAFALLFGAVTNRLGLSPIVGYLLAGVVVGPHTPGFQADASLARQLAEVGVILLMFGVGLHFHFDDLLRVRAVAIPGAVVQILVATALAAVVIPRFGFPLSAAVLLGIAVSVASTVVLVRVLMDNNVLHTRQGHIAVGWLVVEDLFTVLVLVLLPALLEAAQGGGALAFATSFGWVITRIVLLVALVLVGGRRLLPWLMNVLARSRSRELFTLGVLVAAIGVAWGSAVVFDVSMALGAFLAGMVVGQSEVSHQAAADALPLRDAFAVLFFVSVGMLFNPHDTLEHWGLVLAVLAIILVGKPLAALGIVLLLGYPTRAALTVAFALAQIGEFSFILAELGHRLDLLSGAATGVLVSCSIVSITVSPLLFRSVESLERWLQNRPRLWRALNARVRADVLSQLPEGTADEPPRAVVVGYGPVGQTLARLLRRLDIRSVIIDLNIDTVVRLREEGVLAIYGDAASKEILRAARIEEAEFLLVALPDSTARFPVIATARQLNPKLQVIVRARYLQEQAALEEAGVTAVVYEEATVAVALAKTVLEAIGVSEADIEARTRAVRHEMARRLSQGASG